MNPKEIKEVIKYWEITAKRDFDTMKGLFKIKRYPESLFYGHIVLEKILKAAVVENKKAHPPYSHDLVRLAKDSDITFKPEDLKDLNIINSFNIRSRYPEFKLNFYKVCDKKYTEDKLAKVKKIYQKICRELK